MLWVPPPHWLVTIALALLAHIVVIGIVFAARGWKRGVLAIPVGLVAFIASAIGGMMLGGTFYQLDPIPLVTVLAVAVYGAYALMTWRQRPPAP